jgi:hypothetical protein
MLLSHQQQVTRRARASIYTSSIADPQPISLERNRTLVLGLRAKLLVFLAIDLPLSRTRLSLLRWNPEHLGKVRKEKHASTSCERDLLDGEDRRPC